MDAATLQEVQSRVLDWYDEQGRDLPWRRTHDAYAILTAEIMLQQTQVERVIPKWQAWLTQFPTFAALAAASRADAIRAWQGLGYNLRAVRLHTIARQVVEEYGGELPACSSGLRSLKGVGRYTAAAVACFAFGEPVAVVDTNVRRVLGRVFAPAQGTEELAASVLPRHAAYAWNQALMDIGATVCRARRPTCLLCPLRDVCVTAGQTRPSNGVTPPRSNGARQATAGGSSAGVRSERVAAEERRRRGALVDRLRALPVGASLALDELPQDGSLRRRLARLAADGLVVLDGDRVRLAD